MRKLLVPLFTILLSISLIGQTPIKVMTYNIRYDNPNDGENHWELRKRWLANQINFIEPDVLGIQEGLAHQVTFLEDALPTYNHIGVGRDDGKEAGEYTAIFYKSENLELINQNTFWLSETPEKPSVGWDAALERICTYALFQHKVTNQKFWVFNTHFDHVGDTARANSVDLITTEIRKLNMENLPVFLMGDLNLEPDSEPIQKLSSRMNDARHYSTDLVFGPKGTFNGFKHNEPVTRRIDYIFTNPYKVEVRKYAVLSDSKDKKYPSDHLPVVVEAILKQ
ncbi:endonuclease/exonuclease/phosphatase [Roseivirga seohaensis subsp. aquiponti]|uniref:Endonuclease/exonuclease/phosphatase n=1 Tax=Roseivirga seohaensis subsp. aquiponti TaxID=1566026 RepID=A0A0L8ALK4_9BACT|nr:endonuclease/exonuclease/phosphatase family protein [Roseivirga seohaensis]KOF03234.1 endonuclease/exonuclease/phosphatase [Roseivirga seohaensis subsp. aquiponti]